MSRQPRISGSLAYNLYLKSDLLRVAKAFEVQGIPWLLIKGISLADSLYGGIAHRSMVDNDIVVPRKYVERAHHVLCELGFVDREANVLALNLAADFQHPMHFDHPDVQTGLELHWHVHPPELFHSDIEAYFERAVTKRAGECVYRTLCADDRVLHLVTHWVQHGLNKPSILVDLEHAWNAQIKVEQQDLDAMDLPAVALKAQKMGVFAAFCLALSLLEQSGRLSVPVPRYLRSQRADWFLRLHSDVMLSAVESPLFGAREHRLRLASWALLDAQSVWLCVTRELLPTRARLSRIVGRKLTRTQALAVFAQRQARAVKKLFALGVPRL